MTKRERIMTGMGISGGTQAPGGRRKQIREALGSNRRTGGGAVMPPGTPPPKRFPSFGGGGTPSVAVPGKPQPTGRPGAQGEKISASPGPFKVAGAQGAGGNRPDLGRQLSQRVQSGAIDQRQAMKVARQRQTLKKAFGPDWRSKVYKGSGAREIGQGGPFASRQIAAERSKGLQRAKRKLY